MSYKVIEKTDFGIRVRNYSEMSDCNLCKNVVEKSTCRRSECAPNSYYLPDSEVEKLESELTPETFTINDMYVESKLLFDCQDQLKDLQIENKQLKESIKQLEEEKTTELIDKHFYSGLGTMSTKKVTECCDILANNINYCPNCGRKIIRK